jgi:hypothetical protein
MVWMKLIGIGGSIHPVNGMPIRPYLELAHIEDAYQLSVNLVVQEALLGTSL